MEHEEKQALVRPLSRREEGSQHRRNVFLSTGFEGKPWMNEWMMVASAAVASLLACQAKRPGSGGRVPFQLPNSWFHVSSNYLVPPCRAMLRKQSNTAACLTRRQFGKKHGFQFHPLSPRKGHVPWVAIRKENQACLGSKAEPSKNYAWYTWMVVWPLQFRAAIMELPNQTWAKTQKGWVLSFNRTDEHIGLIQLFK